jgi:hypothetical protein
LGKQKKKRAARIIELRVLLLGVRKSRTLALTNGRYNSIGTGTDHTVPHQFKNPTILHPECKTLSQLRHTWQHHQEKKTATEARKKIVPPSTHSKTSY